MLRPSRLNPKLSAYNKSTATSTSTKLPSWHRLEPKSSRTKPIPSLSLLLHPTCLCMTNQSTDSNKDLCSIHIVGVPPSLAVSLSAATSLSATTAETTCDAFQCFRCARFCSYLYIAKKSNKFLITQKYTCQTLNYGNFLSRECPQKTSFLKSIIQPSTDFRSPFQHSKVSRWISWIP